MLPRAKIQLYVAKVYFVIVYKKQYNCMSPKHISLYFVTGTYKWFFFPPVVFALFCRGENAIAFYPNIYYCISPFGKCSCILPQHISRYFAQTKTKLNCISLHIFAILSPHKKNTIVFPRYIIQSISQWATYKFIFAQHIPQHI